MAVSTTFLRITNGLLLGVGVALAGAGGYILADAGSHDDLPEVPSLFEWAGPALIVLGVGVLVLGTLGCFAASKSRFSVMLYILYLLALYTALIAVAAGAAFNLSAVTQYVEDWCSENPDECPGDTAEELEDVITNNLNAAVIAAGSLAAFLILSLFAAVAQGFESAHASGKGDLPQFMAAGGNAGSAMRP